MKKILLFLVLCFLSIQSYSQSGGYQAAKEYAISNGFTLSEERYAYVVQGDYLYFYKTFYAGCSYLVFAVSEDNNVTDVDIYLYNNDGTLYTKDATVDRSAAVYLYPAVNRYLKVVAKNYNSYTPNIASLCRVYVAYK